MIREILERLTRPLRKRAYNKRRDRIILANFKWKENKPILDMHYNPLAVDAEEDVCFFPRRPAHPADWEDWETQDSGF